MARQDQRLQDALEAFKLALVAANCSGDPRIIIMRIKGCLTWVHFETELLHSKKLGFVCFLKSKVKAAALRPKRRSPYQPSPRLSARQLRPEKLTDQKRKDRPSHRVLSKHHRWRQHCKNLFALKYRTPSRFKNFKGVGYENRRNFESFVAFRTVCPASPLNSRQNEPLAP